MAVRPHAPGCGHSSCRQAYIDSGERVCIRKADALDLSVSINMILARHEAENYIDTGDALQVLRMVRTYLETWKDVP